jgi:acetyl esterase/lipase
MITNSLRISGQKRVGQAWLAWLCMVFTAILVSSCSPIGAFNSVAGRDSGIEVVASGIAYGSNPRQQLDIYAPRARSASVPVVVFFYGGSWNSGSRQDYSFVGRALASLGYVTVIADYRLVPEVVFPAFLEDGAQAVRWVADNIRAYGGDPRRLALAGHSAGAYNAAMLALDQRYLRKAGVDPGSIKALVGLAGPYDFFPWTSSAAVAAFGTWPDPAQTQPVTFARGGAPAVYLATGARDTVVKPQNMTTLAARLRASGSGVVERTYPDLDHVGILLAMSRLLREKAPVLDDIGRFLNQRLPVKRS